MLLEKVFTIANSRTIHCVTKPKTFLQIWDCLLTLLPSWQVGSHWETAAAQETQVSAAHRIQVTASLLLPTWAEVCTWQQSRGQSVFTPTDVSWWTNDMKHLFQLNCCSYFFSSLALDRFTCKMLLMARWPSLGNVSWEQDSLLLGLSPSVSVVLWRLSLYPQGTGQQSAVKNVLLCFLFCKRPCLVHPAV